MPKFKKLSQLQKYIEKQYDLGSANGSVIKNATDGVRKTLEEEAKLMQGYLDDAVRVYYSYYDPKEYVRTWNFLKSVRVGVVEEEIDNDKVTYSIRVYFDDMMYHHPSSWEDSFVPLLLEEGWKWKRSGPYHLAYYDDEPGRSVPHYRKFVESAIKQYIAKRGKQYPWLKVYKIIIGGHDGDKKTQFK